MGLAELIIILSLFGPPAWIVQPLPPLTLPVLAVAASVHATASHARAARDPVARVRAVKDRICACKDMECVLALDAELRQVADIKPGGSPELEALAKEMAGCVAAIAKSAPSP